MRCFFMMFLLSGILLSGCVSSERMFKNSPFEQAEEQVNSEAVNIWPLAYKNSDKLSVLWPLYDQDADGMAIRPFFLRDQNEYAILFPLSAWNEQEGWVFNYYWDENENSMIPFFMYRNGYQNYLFIVYINNQDHEKVTWGVVPLIFKGDSYFCFFPLFRTSDEVNFIGPVWWDSSKNEAGETKIDYGFFPLAWKVNDVFTIFPVSWFSDDLNYVGPIWWENKVSASGEVERNYGVFPLIWQNEDGFTLFPLIFQHKDGWTVFPGIANITDDVSYVGPVWWRHKAVESGEVEKGYGVFPLIWQYKDDFTAFPLIWQREDGFTLFPLIWQREDFFMTFPISYISDDFNYAGPVWWNKQTDAAGIEKNSYGIFPFFMKSDDLNIIGPVWQSNKTDESGVEHNSCGFFPLFWMSDSDVALLPLFIKYDGLNAIGPVWWERDNATSQINGYGFFPILTKIGNHLMVFPLFEFSDNFSQVGPVWWKNTVSESGEVEKSSGFFPLFWQDKDGFTVFPLVWQDKEALTVFPGIANITDDVSYVGPVWWKNTVTESGEVEKSSGFFPLFGQDKDGFTVFPLVWQRKDFFMVFPLTYISDDFTLVGPVWLMRIEKEYGESSHDYGFFPLFGTDGDTFVSLPLACNFNSESYQEWFFGKKTSTEVMGLSGLLFNYCDFNECKFLPGTSNDIEKISMRINTSLKNGNDAITQSVIDDGSKLLTSPQQPGFNALDNIEKLNVMKQEIKDKYVRSEPSIETSFSLLATLLCSYEYDSTEHKSSFDILYGIIFTNQKDNQKEDLRFFYYLYRNRANEANERSIDVFPFVNIFSTPNQEKVTWLWKFLGYSTDLKTDETTYYLFFCEF